MNNKKAFKLVKLIIVIAIIAILAVSAGFMLTKGTGKTNTKQSDGIGKSTGNDYGLKVDYNHTYLGTKYDRIIHLSNSDDIDCVYKALHDKDNFTGTVAFVLDSDLDFSGANLKYTSLNNSLDLSDYASGGDTWLPIGGYLIGGLSNDVGSSNDHSAGGITMFNADFYGSGHKITVGNISYSSKGNVGFFGAIGKSSKIYNLELKVGIISGGYNVGGFVGENDGGFVGENDGSIEKSSVVVDSVNGDEDVGGFVGENYGIIENSLAVVNSVSGSNTIGGFVGYNYEGIIKNSSAVVNSVSSSNYIGGFVGLNYKGIIENSSVVVNSINCSGGGIISNVGGFVGGNSGTIKNSSAVVNSINCSGGGIASNVGGFVGYNYEGTIKNSSAVVNSVSGDAGNVGGFVGGNSGTIKNSAVRVMVLDSASSSVSAGYYENLDNTTPKTSTSYFKKAEFFFNDTDRDNDGLNYDGNTLKITSPTIKKFNSQNYPSAFSSSTKWGEKILNNLKKFWTNW